MRSIVIGRFTRTHQDGRTDFEKILGYKKKKKKRKTNYSDGLLLVDREFGYLSIQIVFTEPTERKTTWDFRFVANVQRFFFSSFSSTSCSDRCDDIVFSFCPLSARKSRGHDTMSTCRDRFFFSFVRRRGRRPTLKDFAVGRNDFRLVPGLP